MIDDDACDLVPLIYMVSYMYTVPDMSCIFFNRNGCDAV